MFWFVLGSGIGTSFSLPMGNGTMNYMEYFFPGTIVMILLFTSIFATISIIDDRKEGFLQCVLVAPIPRSTIALGKIAGSTTIALIQGVVFLCLAPLVVELSLLAIPLTLVVLGLVAFGLTGLGYTIAWSLDSTQGFHAIMNLFLIPLWLLSGAVFPPTGAPEWLQWIMALNPLTYGVDAVRWSLYGSVQYAVMDRPAPVLSLAVVTAFAVATFLMSLYITKKR
jgi:ABC-2 type transport system permease protein